MCFYFSFNLYTFQTFVALNLYTYIYIYIYIYIYKCVFTFPLIYTHFKLLLL